MGDDIEENELLSNLNPIIKSNSLWKDTVSDYIKKYYLSKVNLIRQKILKFLVIKMNKIIYLIIFY